MHRRTLLTLLLAACAAPADDTPAQTADAAEPGTRVVIPLPPALAASGSQSFDSWMSDFYARALAAGLPAAVLDRELHGLAPDDRVSALAGRRRPGPRPGPAPSGISQSRWATISRAWSPRTASRWAAASAPTCRS